MKDRDTDPLDVALSDGAGYFVPSKTFKQFFKKTKPPKVEVSHSLIFNGTVDDFCIGQHL